MEIVVGEKTYQVRIWYSSNPAITAVELIDQCCSVVGVGSTRCHERDQFCKATGRKIAFGRALRDCGLGRDERRSAWEQFFAQTRR